LPPDRLRFLVNNHDFVGPESERPWDRIPEITWVRYHRGDMTIEMAHVVGFMGEDDVYTRNRTPGRDAYGPDDWIELGSNATHGLPVSLPRRRIRAADQHRH
jgi:hypothetical protein